MKKRENEISHTSLIELTIDLVFFPDLMMVDNSYCVICWKWHNRGFMINKNGGIEPRFWGVLKKKWYPAGFLEVVEDVNFSSFIWIFQNKYRSVSNNSTNNDSFSLDCDKIYNNIYLFTGFSVRYDAKFAENEELKCIYSQI